MALESGTFKTLYSFFSETLRENQTHVALNITRLSERGLENSMVALFEVIVKILTGCVTQGMVYSGEDSPSFLFKHTPHAQVPKIDKLISSQIISYDNFKVHPTL